MDKTVLEKYTKTYGTRFSRRQKKRFIDVLNQEFHALGYELSLIHISGTLPAQRCWSGLVIAVSRAMHGERQMSFTMKAKIKCACSGYLEIITINLCRY